MEGAGSSVVRQDLPSGNPFETDQFGVFLVQSVPLTPKGVVSDSAEPLPMGALLGTRAEEGSTEQSIETLGFPENSVNRVVRHLTETLAQGNSTCLLSCVFCSVDVFASLLLWIDQQSAHPPAAAPVSPWGWFAPVTRPEPPLPQADGHGGVGAAGGHSLKEMSSVPRCAGPALLSAWAELLQGRSWNNRFIFSEAQ